LRLMDKIHKSTWHQSKLTLSFKLLRNVVS